MFYTYFSSYLLFPNFNLAIEIANLFVSICTYMGRFCSKGKMVYRKETGATSSDIMTIKKFDVVRCEIVEIAGIV